MILFSDIFDNVVRAMRAEDSPAEQDRALRRLNQDAQAIGRKESWAMLRERLEVSWSGAPLLLPSNLVDFDLVWDEDNAIEFIGRNHSHAEKDEPLYRYATYPADAPLVTAKDARLVPGMSSLVSNTLESHDGDLVGEYVQVEGDWQMYQITAQSGNLLTLDSDFKGRGEVSNALAVVRPKGTRMLDLVAPDNTHLPTTNLTLHYWRTPDTLREPMDIVPFPTADVLELRTLSRIPEARKLRPVSQTQVDQALQEALALNPDRPTPRGARDRLGRTLTQSTLHYMPRNGLASGSLYAQSGVHAIWQRNR